MNYDVTIGLEVHVQLKTRSKMFCGCSTAFGAEPNTQVCPVCLGYPGALPVMNGEAIRYTVLAGLMLGCRINDYSKFDRKNYFYPDMPKNYQISQYDQPLCLGGAVEIDVEGRPKTIRLTRIHLEEDVGKNMHFARSSGVDFNRAGIPLMEIVTEPDLASPEEAQAFLLALKHLLLYAGVSECNLEQGNLRCDVNCSIRPRGETRLGVKAEIKNMNTFKGVFHAAQAEIRRQAELLDAGQSVHQETLRYDPDLDVTVPMRSKEYAHDYRYFPEPDLLPVALDAATIEAWSRALPERPRQRRERFVREYGLPEYDARVLVADQAVADYFEETARQAGNPKAASNWVMTEMLRQLTAQEMEIGQARITPRALGELIRMTEAQTINSNTARQVFGILFSEGGDPARIVEERGWGQVSDSGVLEAAVDQVLAANAKSAADYRAGKKPALQFLVGQVMKLTRGKANPPMVQAMLEKKLG